MTTRTKPDLPDSRAPILGWDVGGTKSGAVVATPNGRILKNISWRSAAERGHEPMLRDFLRHARPLLERHSAVRAVGVSIGGPVNPLAGTVHSPPHLPGWDNVPLADLLRRALRLPVVIEHDAAACLEAECLWGAARGCSHAVYLTCGTGCGAGILVGGRILRGPRGESPEAGHVRLAPDGPEAFGKRGCAESFGSGHGLARLAPFLFPEHFSAPVDPRQLVALARRGDGRARAVIAESARGTGQLCALLADIFAPQVIILGSLARYLGPRWLDGIRREFRREALPANRAHTRITGAALGLRLQPLSAVAPVVFRSGD